MKRLRHFPPSFRKKLFFAMLIGLVIGLALRSIPLGIALGMLFVIAVLRQAEKAMEDSISETTVDAFLGDPVDVETAPTEAPADPNQLRIHFIDQAENAFAYLVDEFGYSGPLHERDTCGQERVWVDMLVYLHPESHRRVVVANSYDPDDDGFTLTLHKDAKDGGVLIERISLAEQDKTQNYLADVAMQLKLECAAQLRGEKWFDESDLAQETQSDYFHRRRYGPRFQYWNNRGGCLRQRRERNITRLRNRTSRWHRHWHVHGRDVCGRGNHLIKG